MANNVVKQKFHPLSIHLHRRDADNNRGRNERNKKRKTRRMIYGWLRFIIGLTFEVYCCKWYRCGIKLLDTSEKKTSSILLKHSKFFFYTAKYFRFSLLCSAYFFYSLSNLTQCFLVTDYFPVQYPIVKYGIVLLFLLCVDCPLTRENTVQTTYKCIAGTVMNEKHTFFSRRITLIFHIQLTQLILLFFGPCLLISVRNSHIYIVCFG